MQDLSSLNEVASLEAFKEAGPGAGDSITRPMMKLDGPVRLPDSLPAELVGHRPDIVAERWRVESTAAEIKVAKAQFYPNMRPNGARWLRRVRHTPARPVCDEHHKRYVLRHDKLRYST